MDRKDILNVFREWETNFAPPRFLATEKNARLLTEYLLDTGTVSITAITAAVKALEGALDWAPEPKPKTQKELYLEAQERQREFDRREAAKSAPKEYKEPTKDFDPKEVERQVEQAKKDKASQSQIAALIAGYTPISNHRISYAQQEQEQARMKKAVVDLSKQGVSFQEIAQRVHNHIQGLYEKAEKARERV